MTIESIEFLPVNSNLIELVDISNTSKNSDFSQWLDIQAAEMNKQIVGSELELREFAVGETDNIHHVMMSLEKAKTSFELVLQVRNKLLEGYQEIMRMQV